MRKVCILAVIGGLFIFSTIAIAEEIFIDPLCGTMDHAPCVPGLNAPLPPKKVFDEAVHVSNEGEKTQIYSLLDGKYLVTLSESFTVPVNIIVKLLPYSDEQNQSPVLQLERKLILRAYEDPDLIGVISEDVFEVALKQNSIPLKELAEPITITLPWPSENYMKKVVYVWDGNKKDWFEIPSESNFETRTVSAKWHLPYGQFAVFDDVGTFEGVASWYRFKGCNCAAIKEFKHGTKFKVTNITEESPRYGRSISVTINDYGPAVWTKRLIDLDRVAFRQIANPWNGLALVRVERINL